MRSSHASLDRVELDLQQIQVAFDDQRAVANAGLLLPATLADRLGLEQAADELSTWATGQARRIQAARS